MTHLNSIATPPMLRPVDRLPDVIRVGGFDFRIEKWEPRAAESVHRYGEFSELEQTIRIRSDVATPYKTVDTFLHEVTHAIFWAYGIEDGDKEERIVSVLGSAWMQVYRDNPWLLRWIGETLGV